MYTFMRTFKCSKKEYFDMYDDEIEDLLHIHNEVQKYKNELEAQKNGRRNN